MPRRGYARTWRVEYRATTPEMELIPMAFPPRVEIESPVEISITEREMPVVKTRWQRLADWLRRGWEVDKARWHRFMAWLTGNQEE